MEAADTPIEASPESLKRYLLSFDWPGRDAGVEEMIVEGGMPLWRAILGLLPAPTADGTLLELGSLPFHTTLLAKKFRPYHVVTTAGVVDERRVLRQTLRSAAFAEEHTFECACFDLEHERFPFEDESFDVVLFCEVIEHLSENPVFTLSEIHRVLRPGGALIVSTPNAARSGNLLRIFLGANVFDQYHLGSPLRGTRHSREYTLSELRALIGDSGFTLEYAGGRNLDQIQYTRRTRPLEPFFRFVTRFAPGEHADHLFVRARKSGPFRWIFPREIFDQGHLRWYSDVRDADIVMGVNDVPHTEGFWGPLETFDGRATRAVGPAGGSVVLLAATPADAVEVEITAPSRPLRLSLSASNDGGAELGSSVDELSPGRPLVVCLPLRPPVNTGARVRVVARGSSDVAVHRIRLRSLES